MADDIVELFENPYQRAEIKPHHLDLVEVRLACFDAYNIVTASQALGGEHEMKDGDDDAGLSTLFKLHHELAESRLSTLLLRVALMLRTFDDIMRDKEGYEAHAAATSGENFIGDLDGEPLSLREACNKIIHAVDFRPVYSMAERQEADETYSRVWYMTGEVEIGGMRGAHQWAVLLFVPPFLELVLDRIAFELPAVGAEAK